MMDLGQRDIKWWCVASEPYDKKGGHPFHQSAHGAVCVNPLAPCPVLSYTSVYPRALHVLSHRSMTRLSFWIRLSR
jgi:hypothetical protein